MLCGFWCFFVQILFFIPYLTLCNSAGILTISLKDLIHEKYGTSEGSMFYRYLHVDEANDHLYVGAMQHIYRLSLKNITYNPVKSIELEPVKESLTRCELAYPKTKNVTCQNHVRLIQIYNNGSVWVCGTGAQRPRTFLLEPTLDKLTIEGDKFSGSRKCAFTLDQNFTAVYITNSSAFYYALPQYDNNNKYPSIHRMKEEMSTREDDKSWLQNANFVSSFELGEYVYFWLRESSITKTKGLIPRVARICKNDIPGPQSFPRRTNWFSFIKSELHCPMPFENNKNGIPYLQSTYYLGGKVYAIFLIKSDVTGDFIGSSICVFAISDIEKVIKGQVQKYDDTTETWNTLTNKPNLEDGIQRLKHCERKPQDDQDHTLLSESLLHLQTEHLSLAHSGNALFYSKDKIFTKINVENVDGSNVIFLATSEGTIQKIVTYQKNKGYESHFLAEWKLFDSPRHVYSIVSQKYSIYLGTDNAILQIDKTQCKMPSYQSCHICVRDPHCGWDYITGSCKPYVQGYYRNVSNPEICNSLIRTMTVKVSIPGSGVRLKCIGRESTKYPTNWYIGSDKINFGSSKDYFRTNEDDLIILNASTKLINQVFTCKSTGDRVTYEFSKYLLSMPDCGDCSTEEGMIFLYKQKLSEWNEEFNNAVRIRRQSECISSNYPKCVNPQSATCGK